MHQLVGCEQTESFGEISRDLAGTWVRAVAAGAGPCWSWRLCPGGGGANSGQ